MNANKDYGVHIVGGTILTLFIFLFGVFAVGGLGKQKCIELLKDKPAIEIQAVCK